MKERGREKGVREIEDRRMGRMSDMEMTLHRLVQLREIPRRQEGVMYDNVREQVQA